MSVSIDDVVTHLKSLGYDPKAADNPAIAAIERAIFVPTEHFVDPDAGKQLIIIVRLLQEGAIVEVLTADLYNVRECKFKGIVFATLLEIMLKTNHVQFEYEPSEGTLHVSTDLPIFDSQLSETQLNHLIHSVHSTVERFDAVIRHAIEKGRIDFSLVPSDQPKIEVPAEVAQLIEQLGGIDALKQLVRDTMPGDAP